MYGEVTACWMVCVSSCATRRLPCVVPDKRSRANAIWATAVKAEPPDLLRLWPRAVRVDMDSIKVMTETLLHEVTSGGLKWLTR